MRMTPARKEIYEILTQSMDHPTATDVFIRVKNRVPGISLATVYNNLEALTAAGMIKQVHLERAPSRFCANQHDHVHFHCENCGSVSDVVEHSNINVAEHYRLPKGSRLSRMDVTLRGICPRCSQKSQSQK
jgi:Fur family peroxide stress response transcriptional regulator